MFSAEEFVTWSDGVVLLVHNTSQQPGRPPLEDETHPNLLRATGHNAFPSVCLMAADGKVLRRIPVVRGVADLERAHAQIEAWKALRARAAEDPDDKVLQRQLLDMEIELEIVGFEEARTRAADLDYRGKAKEELEQRLVNLQFLELLQRLDRDNAPEIGARFLEMFEAGRIPTAKQDTTFYQLIFDVLGREGDVERFEKVLGFVRETKQGDPRLQRYVPLLERQLEQLKKRKER